MTHVSIGIDIKTQIRDHLRAMAVDCDSQAAARLAAWTDALEKWNRWNSLTAIKTKQGIIRQLLLPSVGIVAQIQGCCIVDVGSGAGVPGLPLAIISKNLRVTLLECRLKKVYFLVHCIQLLGIDDRVQVLHIRCEDHVPKRPYHCIVSRGIGTVGKFIAMAGHLGNKDSLWCIYKGKMLAQEKQNWQKNKASTNFTWSVAPVRVTPQLPTALSLVKLRMANKNFNKY